jgi:hypothetical protein
MINFNKQKRNKIASILIVLCSSYVCAGDYSPWVIVHRGESITQGGWTEVLPSTNIQWNKVDDILPDFNLTKSKNTAEQYTLVQYLRGRGSCTANQYINRTSLYTKPDQQGSCEVLLLGHSTSDVLPDPLPDNNQYLAGLTLTEYNLSLQINDAKQRVKYYEVHIKTNVALNGYALLYVLRALGEKSGIWKISNEWGIQMDGDNLASTGSKLVFTRSTTDISRYYLTLDTVEAQEVPQWIQFSEADDGFLCVNPVGSPLPQPSSKDSDGITFVAENVGKVSSTDGSVVIVNSSKNCFLSKGSFELLVPPHTDPGVI